MTTARQMIEYALVDSAHPENAAGIDDAKYPIKAEADFILEHLRDHGWDVMPVTRTEVTELEGVLCEQVVALLTAAPPVSPPRPSAGPGAPTDAPNAPAPSQGLSGVNTNEETT